MTRPRLTGNQLHEGVRAGFLSGRFVWSPSLHCTFCGRRGSTTGPWMEACILGHPYACACGRVFSTRQGIATHRRKAHP